jgi:heat-inducible transcriptional repressor
VTDEKGPLELDARKAAILKTVVTDYVETAQPVGSSQVARDSSIDVSPATIRADMATLERDGFLTHPHTSAGRVPTDKGYRFFVDHLASPLPLLPQKQEQVREFFSRAHGEIERMLHDTSQLLAGLTDCTAVVVSTDHERLVVRTALLTRLARRTALLVVVLSNGAVDKQAIAIDEDVADEDVAEASAYLQQHFCERTLAQLASEGIALAETRCPNVDSLVQLCRLALDTTAEPESRSDQVFVGGTSLMAERFGAVEQVRAVLSILEQSYVVVSLLQDVIAQGLSVSIGSENRLEPLAECSLVVAPIAGEDGTSMGTGAIGVLGPTRMDYPQALAAVAVVGQRLSRQLQEG